jgi:hypothetical protein
MLFLFFTRLPIIIEEINPTIIISQVLLFTSLVYRFLLSCEFNATINRRIKMGINIIINNFVKIATAEKSIDLGIELYFTFATTDIEKVAIKETKNKIFTIKLSDTIPEFPSPPEKANADRINVMPGIAMIIISHH